MRWINTTSLLWLLKAAGNLRELLCSFQYQFNGLLQHQKAPQNNASRYCAVAFLVFCKDRVNAFMPFPSKSRSRFYWGHGGVNTLGSSILCAWGCCHSFTCLMSVAEVLYIFRHGALGERNFWAGWCTLHSKVTVFPQRGNGPLRTEAAPASPCLSRTQQQLRTAQTHAAA